MYFLMYLVDFNFVPNDVWVFCYQFTPVLQILFCFHFSSFMGISNYCNLSFLPFYLSFEVFSVLVIYLYHQILLFSLLDDIMKLNFSIYQPFSSLVLLSFCFLVVSAFRFVVLWRLVENLLLILFVDNNVIYWN